MSWPDGHKARSPPKSIAIFSSFSLTIDSISDSLLESISVFNIRVTLRFNDSCWLSLQLHRFSLLCWSGKSWKFCWSRGMCPGSGSGQHHHLHHGHHPHYHHIIMLTWWATWPWSWMRGWTSDSPLPASSSCGTHWAVLLRMMLIMTMMNHDEHHHQ